jgi:predicted permease
MSLLDALRHRIRAALRSEQADRERAEEHAIHQSLAQEQRTHDGASVDDARFAARREFGNATYLKEEARWMGVTRWLDVTRQDLGYASRALRRSPVFTLVAIASLGLGIGANAAIFGMIHSLLLAKLAIANPEALRLVIHSRDGPMRAFFASGEVQALTAGRQFDLATFHTTVAANAEINGLRLGGLNMDAVDGSFFRVAGVRVSTGRPISAADVENAAQVAVLSTASATATYGSARAALGKVIRLNDVLFTVVGVSDAGYEGLALGGDYAMAVPTTAVPAMQHRPVGERRPDLFLIARPGADSSRLQSALDASFARCCAAGALTLRGSRQGEGIQRIGFLDISSGITEGRKIDVRRQYGSVLFALMGGVAVLLLIACTNVGNLLMARAAARAREMAVRLSLGASRGRIVRQLLAESLLLAVLGGVAGIALAIWGSAALSRNLPAGLGMLGPFVAIRPSLVIFGFTASVALTCGLIFGVVPAIRATGGDVVAGLRDHQAAGRRVRALDKGVVAIQVGLALLLLSSAGLLSATLRHLTESVGGSHPETLLVVQLDVRGTAHSDTLLQATVPTLHARFAAMPGVKSVVESFVVPLIYGGLPTKLLDAPGFENASEDQVEVASFAVAPRYFETLGITLVAGRDFGDQDVVGSPRAAVISEHLARDFFPGRSPIGQSIGFRGADGRDLTIVGVVADAKQTDLRSPAPNTVYLTRRQWPDLSDRAVFAIRTTVPPAQLVAPARAIILGELPKVRIRHLLPMTDLLSMTVGRESALASLSVAFGFVALLLAAIGLYGVMAFQVSARTREIGVRMALGAGRSQVVRMVIGQALLVVAIGVGVGIPFALAGARSLRALLYGITPFDPVPLASGAAVLVIVGALAALIPSRNAARVDPLVAIRCE